MGLLSWLAVLSLFFYLIPFARLVSRPLRAVMAEQEKNRTFPYPPWLVKLGRWEYLGGPLRDRVITFLLLGTVLYYWFTESPLSVDTLIASPFIVTYALLAIVAIAYRDSVRMKLTELARTQSNIHPEDFFNLYYALLSPWPPPFPESGFRKVDFNDADYRSGEKPILTFWPLLDSVWMTNTLARLAIMAFKRVGPTYGRDAFDGLARLWGSAAARNLKARLHTLGSENLPPLEGKTLLLFNHKSVLDFAFNFFALGSITKKMKDPNPGDPPGSGTRHLRPRFIAARDHFIDNPFIYSWVSVGKCIENAGMIFINRKKGKGWAAMAEAAKKLVDSDVEIAVYPQGTRAFSLKSPTGERLDAGYYTTFSKKTWDLPLGHLKPGTAHLILDTLHLLQERGEDHLNILVVGMSGTGSTWAKKSFQIQTETEVEYKIAPLWVLPTQWAQGIRRPEGPEATSPEERLYLQRIEELQITLNQKLLEATDWHRQLRKRVSDQMAYLRFSSEEIASLDRFLQERDLQGDSMPFILVDRILSLKPNLWERFLRLLYKLKDDRQDNPAWRALLQEVSERLLSR